MTTMNHSMFYKLIKPTASSFLFFRRNAFQCPLIGILKQYHNTTSPNIDEETEPFSLVSPWNRTNMVYDCWRSLASEIQILAPGVVLLKNYLTIRGQVDIFNVCQKWCLRSGGFYQPRNQSGDKLRLYMKCFGRNWDPVTKYEKCFTSDGSLPPPVPYEFISLVENIFEELKPLGQFPTMEPDFAVANFYTFKGRLGLHQDRDESFDSLKKGLPVVSISIGDTAEFFYGHTREIDKLDYVLLQSGDILIFGAEARLIFHGVKRLLSDSTPRPIWQETDIIPGRLNITLRQTT